MKLPDEFVKKTKKTLLSVVIAVAIAVPVRAALFSTYRAKTDAVSPEVPKGSYVIVYKLATSFRSGDIVVYRGQDKAMLGRVMDFDKSTDIIRVERRDGNPKELSPTTVIGRAVLNTR